MNTTDRTICRISLERPASLRRHLPLASDHGWMLPDYLVGPENEALLYLFEDKNILNLGSLSPVVFYGEKNVGKTALSLTLAVSWSRLSRLRPLAFTTGQTFAADYASAIEIDDIASFRQRHRACQLLVIDDLDPIAKSPAAQQELVGSLDALAESSRPVIISVSRLPSGIRGLSPPLASRLAGGFSIALQKPGPETLKQIVQAVVRLVDPQLPVEELVAFCTRFTAKPLTASDVHKIVTIAAQNKASSGSVDFHILSQLAIQLFDGDGPSIGDIAKVVAKKMRVRLIEMRGASRQASIVRARGLAIFLTRKLTSTSLQQIGEFFGGRDHSTVIHACRKTEKLLNSDPELASLLQEAQAELLP